MTDYGEELDSIVDEHRERRAMEREALAEFACPDDTTRLTKNEDDE